jgi:hypothetical protein
MTNEDRAAWTKGSIEDWVLEGHRLAQTVAYGDLGSQNPAVVGPDYKRQAEPVIETQLEKAGVSCPRRRMPRVVPAGALPNPQSSARSPG